jgi:hypothetical protein
MRISFEPGGCASGRASSTCPTDRTTHALRLPPNHATHRRDRLRLTRIPLYSWRSRAAASTERRAGRKAKHSIQGSLHKVHRAPRSRPSREWAGGQSQSSPPDQRPRDRSFGFGAGFCWPPAWLSPPAAAASPAGSPAAALSPPGWSPAAAPGAPFLSKTCDFHAGPASVELVYSKIPYRV